MPLPPVDDVTLLAYLSDQLPAPALARVEKALRESAELRDRLELLRRSQEDSTLHSLGAIWRRSRLSCPAREQLGSYLLDALDPDYAAYVRFHLETVACPFCQANLTDLKSKAEKASALVASRHRRILDSSRHLLSGDS